MYFSADKNNMRS